MKKVVKLPDSSRAVVHIERPAVDAQLWSLCIVHFALGDDRGRSYRTDVPAGTTVTGIEKDRLIDLVSRLVPCYWDPNKPLFKFFDSSDHAEQFLNEGTIRIGTLRGFRAEEQLGNEIGDSKEGFLEVYDTIEDMILDPAAYETASWPVRQVFANGAEGARISNLRVAGTIDGDMHILCLSATFTPSLMKRMNKAACVRIDNWWPYFQGLSLTRHKVGKLSGLIGPARCRYVGRAMHHEDAAIWGAWIVKPERYEYQDEVRVGWPRLGYSGLKPFFVNGPRGERFAKQIA